MTVLELKYGVPAFLIAAPDENGCELWLGGTSKGYGKYAGDLVYFTAYVFAHGPVPDGLEIDHRCRVKLCVNPAHLRAVTHKKNLENRGPQVNSKSGVRNVSWDRGKWRVYVRHYGKSYYGGSFTDIEEAERAAIALRHRLFDHTEGECDCEKS